MNERDDLGRRLHEACWSGSVPALVALLEKDPLILDRVSSLTCFSNDTPLHVAASRGHLDFTKALLARKPKLATELDSLRCSPLHLASSEGYVEIVQELLRVNKDLCFARDQDGSDKTYLTDRIPLHLAAMKGRVETIKFLLELKSVKDEANVKNHNGSTALDVVEDCPNRDEKTMDIRNFLAQAGVCRSNPPSKLHSLHLFWNKYFLVGSDWLREKRDARTPFCHHFSLTVTVRRLLHRRTPATLLSTAGRARTSRFFKDRHYLDKDWGKYFSDDSSAASPNGKVILEVGCGAGNTVFPLVAKYPKLFVHACDFSPHAISHVDFNEDQVNAFLCDVVTDDLGDTMMPSSIDVVTLIFMLSAVCPKKMHLILQNVKKVLKPDGHILLRDYAIGDYAQVELDKRNQMISENFYIRGDGTSAFYFSEEFLSTLFGGAGFTIVDMDIYGRQIQNRSQNITMSRMDAKEHSDPETLQRSLI
ncbi:hypothetical protein RHSIM_Rhsim12G0208300 [Rhododendron simsii]|uniref:Methyltransferase type 12 domain-containing protein n=1 Tax=Rhododendron simsii TaxID=118357 RepID=A0A834L930_RHOSS|nr:hypothetical protein RHSIM_Rhsim12G0208300 [Rhododendron simsii]